MLPFTLWKHTLLAYWEHQVLHTWANVSYFSYIVLTGQVSQSSDVKLTEILQQ